jgi:S1-C subfamily serine protease
MSRLFIALFALLLLRGTAVAGEDDQGVLQQALSLQQTVRNVVSGAERSIACILVSRSDAYKRYYRDEPPVDNPGKLGSFPEPGRAPTHRPRLEEFDQSESKETLYDLSRPRYIPESFGSGVVIDGPERLILTNYHVVRDATKIYVRLLGGKGSYADIYAGDPRSDLAVLRLVEEKKIRSLQPLKVGEGESAQKGDFVILLANPFAVGSQDGSPSASWGIISNIRRRIPPQDIDEERSALHIHGTLLQTDARLNLGCSGGALLNLRGELIGLVTSRAALTGAESAGGFAIPLDAGMRRVLERLRQGREVEYGFLGVQPAGIDEEGAGIRLEQVTLGSPAFAAQLHGGDTIEAIDGVPVRRNDDLFLHIGTLLAGSEVELKIRSRERLVRVQRVQLAKLHVPGPIIAARKPAAVRGIRVDYTSALFMQNFAQMRRLSSILPGVYVREVVAGSSAATAQLKINEIITHVNGQEVNTPDAFYREAAKISASEPLKLTLSAQDFHRNPETTELIIP